MTEDALSLEPVPTWELGGVTLVFDLATRRLRLRLAGLVALPVGALLDLPGEAEPARVVAVRLLAGEGSAAAHVCLEVDTRAGEAAAATSAEAPEPIAAATATIPLDPDATRPVRAPSSP